MSTTPIRQKMRWCKSFWSRLTNSLSNSSTSTYPASFKRKTRRPMFWASSPPRQILPGSKVIVEKIYESSTPKVSIDFVDKFGDNWMTPIEEYLQNDTLPTDKKEFRKIQLKYLQYVVQDGVLYRRSYLQPFLWCVGITEANYLICEFHEGVYSNHVRPRVLALKIMHNG